MVRERDLSSGRKWLEVTLSGRLRCGSWNGMCLRAPGNCAELYAAKSFEKGLPSTCHWTCGSPYWNQPRGYRVFWSQWIRILTTDLKIGLGVAATVITDPPQVTFNFVQAIPGSMPSLGGRQSLLGWDLVYGSLLSFSNDSEALL